jgi:hypothetical protein
VAKRTRRQAIPVQNTIAEDVAYVRFLHGVPTIPAVDTYIDGNLLVDNISYGMSTPYYELPAGNALFTFYRAGTSDELLGQTSICRVQAYLQSPPQGFPAG